MPTIQAAEPVRTVHAELTTDVPRPVEEVFDAFTGFARHDLWAPDVEGACHWLYLKEGGSSSRFLAYRQARRRHLTPEGVVTELEHPRRFAWTAPFGEWPRAMGGGEVDIEPTEQPAPGGRARLPVRHHVRRGRRLGRADRGRRLGCGSSTRTASSKRADLPHSANTAVLPRPSGGSPA